MPETPSPAHRQPYPGGPVPGAVLMRRLLMAQDGSMTRLCEALAGGPVHLQLIAQRPTREVPAQVREALRGEWFIERISSLVLHGQVLTDNLVYVALDGLDPALREQLQSGGQPIGHLITGRWARRDPLRASPALLAPLWRAVGQADPDATRCYAMHTPDGPPMLICETLRHALWALASGAPTPGTAPEAVHHNGESGRA